MQKLLLLTLLIPGIIPSQIQTGSISGQVRVADGTPVAGVEIIVTSATLVGPGAPALTGTARTDAAGRYTIRDIPPGDYHVIASLDSRVYHPGVTRRADAKAVTVKPGAVIDGIVFGAVRRTGMRGTTFGLVTSGVSVSGRIVGAPGKPSQYEGGLSLGRATDRSPDDPPLRAFLRPDNSFEFPSVPPGTYLILFLGTAKGAADVIAVVLDRELFVADSDLTNIEFVIRD